MSIRNSLVKLALQFQEEKFKSPIINGQRRIPKNHSIYQFVNKTIPKLFYDALGEDINSCSVKASVGITNWRKDAPWIAFLHPAITNSAEHGYYPVYLFSRDFKTVLLELGQGETFVKKKYKKEAKFILQSRAAIIRNKATSYEKYFKILNNVKADRQDWLVNGAFGKLYTLDKLPNDEILIRDLKKMISLYLKTINLGGISEDFPIEDLDTENTILTGKEKRQVKEHQKQESIVSYRDTRFMNQLKKEKNFTCESCGLNFKKIYGEYEGRIEFIEAHHIIPISKLKVGTEIKRNKEDFAILCSNCHRMIHRYGVPTLLEFKKKINNEYLNFIKKFNKKNN